MKNISIITEPEINKASLSSITLDKLGTDQIDDTRQVLFRKDDKSNKLSLCWEIITTGDMPNNAYLDAHTGDVIYMEPLYHSEIE